MKINTADLPVRMAFKTANLHNSLTALGAGGAEKLKGNGDMLFKGANGIQHMQGAYVSPDVIEKFLFQIRAHYGFSPFLIKAQKKVNRATCRGPYGFTITEADLQQREDELQAERVQPSFRGSAKANDDVLFASVLLWALEQKEISCNQISEGFSVGWRRANEFIARLHDMGIVGELDAKLPRKVLVHSVEDASPAVAELLRKSGLNIF